MILRHIDVSGILQMQYNSLNMLVFTLYTVETVIFHVQLSRAELFLSPRQYNANDHPPIRHRLQPVSSTHVRIQMTYGATISLDTACRLHAHYNILIVFLQCVPGIEFI